MIHGAMGAGHGRCAVANRIESAPTHCVRTSVLLPAVCWFLDSRRRVSHQVNSYTAAVFVTSSAHRNFSTIPTGSAGCPLHSIPHMIHRNVIPVTNLTANGRSSSRGTNPAPRSMRSTAPIPRCRPTAWQSIRARRFSMRESLAEINDQKAEKFLNTFYFQYGHRSIADLAHIAFAIERLSILAATVAVDEPRWDGQERSTRYQDFQKSGYYVPDFGDDAAAARSYRETVDHAVRRVSPLFRGDVRLPAGAHTQAGGDEAGGLRTHPARPGLRHFALPAAAGGQHFAGPDRQRAHFGEPGLAPAVAHPRRGAPPGRAAASRRLRSLPTT